MPRYNLYQLTEGDEPHLIDIFDTIYDMYIAIGDKDLTYDILYRLATKQVTYPRAWYRKLFRVDVRPATAFQP